MTQLDIVGINTGYFLGYDGRTGKYIRHPLRSVIGNREVEQERLQRLANTIDQIAPDIVGLVEIDQGSIRTGTSPPDGQAETLRSQLTDSQSYEAKTAGKYWNNQLIQHLPIFGSMANGALFQKGTINLHHLNRGWKRLMIEITIDDLSIFICHLPFPPFHRTQRHQLQEIAEIIETREQFLLYGDFNLTDLGELDVLRNTQDATIHSPGPTYPTHQPDRRFDLFITGPNVTTERCELMPVQISDHRGIKVTINV